MASNARIFLAGIGTVFVILAAGLGGGHLFAKSALHDQPTQPKTSYEPASNIRVVLPLPSEPWTKTASAEPVVQAQPVKATPAPVEPSAEKTNPEKSAKAVKAERRRHAERKARRLAAARARQQREPQAPREPGIMAFGGDISRTSFLGN